MAQQARERLARMLGDPGGRGTFSARRTTRPDDLHIDVAGVGPVTMPVSAAQAKRLIAVARPAQYGLGERTLTDATVRHTWQVPRSRVRIDRRRWNGTLTPLLDGLRGDLGLPPGSRLRAELHSFLVYSPGQFFLPHQDSEKSDDMVGTLTVTLPGSSRGGELIVEHGGERIAYTSSSSLLSFVAFYSDCRHEVKPVTSGYRVVLTFNLLLAGRSTAPDDPGGVAAVADCLAEHFTDHRRLAYLLDHQYTERGLSWRTLKGQDAQRVSLLRAAAEASGCQLVLALAEVHESWSATEEGGRFEEYRYGYADQDDDADDDADVGPDGYELDELLESSVALGFLVDPSGAPMPPAHTQVDADEVCATTPTRDLTPYESDYEGYMGNYGNTLDRWYRRGAVLVWPTRIDFEVRAEASPRWALDTLECLVRDGEVELARVRAEQVRPFWARLGTDFRDEGPVVRIDLGQALGVARGLDDPALADLLLQPFTLGQVTPDVADRLVALADGNGAQWVQELLSRWNGLSAWTFRAAQESAWLASLPDLCAALRDAQGDAVAALLLAIGRDRLAARLRQARTETAPSRRAQVLDGLTASFVGLIRAAVGSAPDILDGSLADLGAHDELLPLAVQVLRALAPAQSDTDLPASSATAPLTRQVRVRLDARLAEPPRDPDDWSIDPPTGCDCALCGTLGAFLADAARRTFDWPIKQQDRRHVHDRIDRHELPVRHQTRRTGSPYTLVLTKTPDLFEQAARRRLTDERDRDWLRQWT